MPARTPRVLVVEDTVSNVILLEAKLVNEAFQVQVAFDGAEALAKLDQLEFDVVLLDVMLPGIDGFEVCRRIRRHPTAAGVPVIMLTALDGPKDRTAGLAAGADDFFVKPVEDEILFARLRELVRGRQSADLAEQSYQA